MCLCVTGYTALPMASHCWCRWSTGGCNAPRNVEIHQQQKQGRRSNQPQASKHTCNWYRIKMLYEEGNAYITVVGPSQNVFWWVALNINTTFVFLAEISTWAHLMLFYIGHTYYYKLLRMWKLHFLLLWFWVKRLKSLAALGYGTIYWEKKLVRGFHTAQRLHSLLYFYLWTYWLYYHCIA